jgi:aspartate kinase
MVPRTPDEAYAAAAIRRGELGFEPPRGVTRIEAWRGLARVAMGCEGRPKDLTRIFRPLTDAGISVDLIKLHESSLHFALPTEDLEHCLEVLRGLGCQVEALSDCALVTVFAPDMRSIAGVMGRIVGALQRAGVSILETDDSYNAVFCLVEVDHARQACEALADEFDLAPEDLEGPSVNW